MIIFEIFVNYIILKFSTKKNLKCFSEKFCIFNQFFDFFTKILWRYFIFFAIFYFIMSIVFCANIWSFYSLYIYFIVPFERSLGLFPHYFLGHIFCIIISACLGIIFAYFDTFWSYFDRFLTNFEHILCPCLVKFCIFNLYH